MHKNNESSQPNSQTKRDGLSNEKSGGQREGWDVKSLSEEASQIDEDEIQRNLRRGNEIEGDADERDIAGGPPSEDTPQGREETKNDVKGKANING